LAITTVSETASTNADMLLRAKEGAPEGDWLRAECQTAGRGRMARDWVSPVGNLYASTIIRLRPSDPPAPTLALVAAVALHRVVSEYVASMLKWPNDLMVQGRKLSGILLERADDAIVAGFGVNLAGHPDLDRPVTSIFAETGVAPDPAAFCEHLAGSLADALIVWRRDLAEIIALWEGAAHPPGTALSVDPGTGDRIDGQYLGLTPDGALRLALADGGERVIHAGDVFLI
jgi:BirA family transcriptional regulator, biotin operon repressor / biotin---[acetyl-CoA-carboxylase] ligase